MSLWSLMCIKLRARGKMRLVDKYVHRTYKKNYTSLFRLQILFHAHIKIFESICLPVCSACCYTSIFDAMCLYWTVHSHTSFYNAHKRNGTERNERMVMCAIFFVSSQTSIVIRLLILINTECVRDMTVDLLWIYESRLSLIWIKLKRVCWKPKCSPKNTKSVENNERLSN